MPLEAGNNQRQVWTVSALVEFSRELLAKTLPFVWVRGEISGFSAPVSGHWYFDLKDERALIAVAMFKSANSQVPFELEEGMEIILGGEVAIYPSRGKFQIVAEILEPVGWGAFQLAYEQLKARLDTEGLFDAEATPAYFAPLCWCRHFPDWGRLARHVPSVEEELGTDSSVVVTNPRARN